MIDLEIFTDKISQTGLRIMERAYEEALLLGHTQLKPEHVLKAIIEIDRPMFERTISDTTFDTNMIVESLQSRLKRSGYIGERAEMSNALRTILATALKRAHEHGRRMIESEDLLVVLYKGRRSLIGRLSRREGFLRRLLKRYG